MDNTTYEPIPDDLTMPATKGDLTNLATKAELNATKAELVLLRQDMNDNFANLPSKEDFSQLLITVDKLAGEVKTYNEERSVEGARLERIETWIKKAADAINIPIQF